MTRPTYYKLENAGSKDHAIKEWPSYQLPPRYGTEYECACWLMNNGYELVAIDPKGTKYFRLMVKCIPKDISIAPLTHIPAKSTINDAAPPSPIFNPKPPWAKHYERNDKPNSGGK